MHLYIPIVTTALITPFISAFEVSLYDEPNCAGEPLGIWTGGLESACSQDHVGTGSGVVVESSSSADDNAVVSFYSSDDCNPSNAIAEANDGCIAIDSFAGEYKSFNVVAGSDDGAKNRRHRRDIAQFAHRSRDASEDTSAVTNHDDDNTVISSNTSEKLPQTRAHEHGEVSDYFGKTYKWHQVAQGMWRGINPEDWDDETHVKSDQKIEPAPLSTTQLSTRNHGELEGRDFLWGTCQAVKNCSIRVSRGVVYGIGYVYLKILYSILQFSGARNFWEFLNQPFVAAATFEGIPGIVSLITTHYQDVSKCSSVNKDIDAMSSLIGGLVATAPTRAFSASIQVGSATGVLSMEAVPNSQRGDQNTCGAPATDPTTSPPRKLLRSAKFLDLV